MTNKRQAECHRTRGMPTVFNCEVTGSKRHPSQQSYSLQAFVNSKLTVTSSEAGLKALLAGAQMNQQFAKESGTCWPNARFKDSAKTCCFYLLSNLYNSAKSATGFWPNGTDMHKCQLYMHDMKAYAAGYTSLGCRLLSVNEGHVSIES